MQLFLDTSLSWALWVDSLFRLYFILLPLLTFCASVFWENIQTHQRENKSEQVVFSCHPHSCQTLQKIIINQMENYYYSHLQEYKSLVKCMSVPYNKPKWNKFWYFVYFSICVYVCVWFSHCFRFHISWLDTLLLLFMMNFELPSRFLLKT